MNLSCRSLWRESIHLKSELIVKSLYDEGSGKPEELLVNEVLCANGFLEMNKERVCVWGGI